MLPQHFTVLDLVHRKSISAKKWDPTFQFYCIKKKKVRNFGIHLLHAVPDDVDDHASPHCAILGVSDKVRCFSFFFPTLQGEATETFFSWSPSPDMSILNSFSYHFKYCSFRCSETSPRTSSCVSGCPGQPCISLQTTSLLLLICLLIVHVSFVSCPCRAKIAIFNTIILFFFFFLLNHNLGAFYLLVSSQKVVFCLFCSWLLCIQSCSWHYLLFLLQGNWIYLFVSASFRDKGYCTLVY